METAPPVPLSGMPRINGTFSFTVAATDSNGGTGSHAYTMAVASPLGTSANAIYVENLYGLLLHRPADPGASGWVTMLNQGVAASTVVADIEQTTEYLDDVVTAIYGHYLNRAPDPAGLSYWVGELQGGATIEQVVQGFIASPEFYQVQGHDTNAGFVTVFYRDILNRSPDPSGYAYWLNALNTGAATPAAMAWGFLTSPEYRTDLLAGQSWSPAYSPVTNWGGYYPEFLRRAADSGGVADWLAAFQAGMTDQQVLAAILGSEEGFADWS